MKIECTEEFRLVHEGREYLFEERAAFGYVYQVGAQLGNAAIATGKCRKVEGNVQAEAPWSNPVPA